MIDENIENKCIPANRCYPDSFSIVFKAGRFFSAGFCDTRW